MSAEPFYRQGAIGWRASRQERRKRAIVEIIVTLAFVTAVAGGILIASLFSGCGGVTAMAVQDGSAEVTDAMKASLPPIDAVFNSDLTIGQVIDQATIDVAPLDAVVLQDTSASLDMLPVDDMGTVSDKATSQDTGTSFDLAMADTALPLASADLANPPDLAQPDLVALLDLAQPDLANPDLATPDLAMPDLVPPCTFDSGAGAVCSGTCVDLDNDKKNCGRCGNACGQYQVCYNAVCYMSYGAPCTFTGVPCVPSTTCYFTCDPCGFYCSR